MSESWKINDFQQDNFYVLAPGADKSYREWPITSYAGIAQLIYENTGWPGLICGTEKEGKIYGDAIREITPDGKLVWEWGTREMEIEK